MQTLIKIGNVTRIKQQLTKLDLGTRIMQHMIKISNWYENNAIPDQYW